MIEIERKYVLSSLPSPEVLGEGMCIKQGYIDAGDPEIRLRKRGHRSLLTVKSGEGIRRQEFEVEISEGTFDKLWPLTDGARVVKTRYTVADGDDSWEVDVYGEMLNGL